MIELFDYMNEFLLVIFAMFIAVVSPGPDFAFILKQSISYGRRVSIITSIGIGLGIAVHIIYSILGVGLLISQSIVLFNIVKFLGAGYLIYLGYLSLRSKGSVMDESIEQSKTLMSAKKAFVLGFLCNALNPKATLFFVSLFSVVVSFETPLIIQSIYGITCIIMTTLWFVFLSLILSSQAVRSFFKRFGVWFERAVGGVLIALGLKIALSNA